MLSTIYTLFRHSFLGQEASNSVSDFETYRSSVAPNVAVAAQTVTRITSRTSFGVYRGYQDASRASPPPPNRQHLPFHVNTILPAVCTFFFGFLFSPIISLNERRFAVSGSKKTFSTGIARISQWDKGSIDKSKSKRRVVFVYFQPVAHGVLD